MSDKLRATDFGDDHDQEKSTTETTSTSEVQHDRRKFAQGLATALGIAGIVGTAAASSEAKEIPGPDHVKSRILRQIQKDIEVNYGQADCYNRGAVGDHYQKGAGCIMP